MNSEGNMIQITINGEKVEVPAGTTVLNAARAANVEIPTLCDFPSLDPYGGCRLCVVEVEGARTLQPSCTLPVSKDMVVYTNTPKVRDARKFVLTMLFSERNHFCMYCQVSGGDCELQNAALDEGMTHWPIQPTWEPYPVDASHPFFVLDHNRCILCRRCVRACGELVGNFTLGTEERGASTMIIADTNVPLGESSCIRCGTCVSVCPTGALIDRQSAYRGRIADATHVASVCTGCSVGCGIDVVVRDNQLIKVNGNWEAPVNAGLLCENGRWDPIFDEQARILTPMVRKDGQLKATTWDEALQAAAGILKPLADKNGTGVAALASTRLPAESLHAFQDLFAGKLGADMVASIEEDFTTAFEHDTAIPAELKASLADLQAADVVVAFGSDLIKHHQVAGFFVKRNLPKGTRLIVIDAGENKMHELATYSLKPSQPVDAAYLANFSALVAGQSLDAGADLSAAAKLLASASHPVIVFGKDLTASKRAIRSDVITSLVKLAQTSGAKLLNPKGRANSSAAHAYGLDKPFQMDGRQAVFLALGDDTASARLVQQLEKAPALIVQASYTSQATAKADVVFPVQNWSEFTGHFVNLEGRLQQANASLTAPEGVRSSADALQSLADALGYSLDADWQSPLATVLMAEQVPA